MTAVLLIATFPTVLMICGDDGSPACRRMSLSAIAAAAIRRTGFVWWPMIVQGPFRVRLTALADDRQPYWSDVVMSIVKRAVPLSTCGDRRPDGSFHYSRMLE
jgi:hypothetical protein